MLEITGDDIEHLKDADLRELIGLLCEADYRLAGLSTSGITWGGHQDAKDGGLDVIVRSEVTPPKDATVPKPNTGFQVKKPDMQPAAIKSEMRPKGELRPSIKNLIKSSGAYIIACTGGSVTEIALKNRLAAMREAVADEKNHSRLHIDFLDRGRIATWVRRHPAMILYVRNKIGRPIFGWKPYQNWANAKGSIDEKYFLDAQLRLHDGNKTEKESLSVEAGILRLRNELSAAGKSIRLAGLSGVGKTRFVQALFDERVAPPALNRFQVFYTDVADSPTPDPRIFAEQLIAEQTRAILVVDNCPPQLHRTLTQTCAVSNSKVSLITVEYDVRDDLPEETSVFRLEPASDEVITTLIKARFSHISQIDRETIARFSGGNARVAIALAQTMHQGDTLSGFRDEQLFTRLFEQRNDPDKILLHVASVCSLVYSFDGVDTITEAAELKFLSSLANVSVDAVFQCLNELRNRGLLQARGDWRAVLPHAIANRLAKNALQSIPPSTLLNAFVNLATDRLMKSFSRRLNYLHDSDVAIGIVNSLLAKDGWIGQKDGDFNSLEMEVFRNLSPVSPQITLQTIEAFATGEGRAKFLSDENTHHPEFIKILRQIAYEAQYFERCSNLMCQLVLNETRKNSYKSARDSFRSLFYLYLSGTHAPANMRAAVIKGLITSDAPKARELGLDLLDAALEAWHFSSGQLFEFGARPRDYGFTPKTRKELIHWYETFIGLVKEIFVLKTDSSTLVINVLAKHFRGLWSKAEVFDALEAVTQKIVEQQSWGDGWIAVSSTIRYDSAGFKPIVALRLKKLEKSLRPQNLLERARIYALSHQHHLYDIDDSEKDDLKRFERVEQTSIELGKLVVNATDIFHELLPSLVTTHGVNINAFGGGLAEGTDNPKRVWDTLYAKAIEYPKNERQFGVFIGFLCACARLAPETYQAILDKLVEDKEFGDNFPRFQSVGGIDGAGVKRLHKALDLGLAHIENYRYIGWGRAHATISDGALAELVAHLNTKEGGVSVSLEILSMRFHGVPKEDTQKSKILISIACDTLSLFSFSGEDRRGNVDHELSSIGSRCLIGEDGEAAARKLLKAIADAIISREIYSFNYPSLMQTLARMQPAAFVDVLLGGEGIKSFNRLKVFSDDFDRSNPLDHVPDSIFIEWCQIKPAERYPLVAEAITAFSVSRDGEGLDWKPLAYTMIEKAPVVENVLQEFARGVRPTGWSGSRADILEKRLILFERLFENENSQVVSWAKGQYSVLQKEINQERIIEASRFRERNESFE